MKKLFKYLFITLFALIVLVIGAVFLIDPNDFKEQITTQVKETLGRDFAINGDISRTLWPHIGLSIEGVVLGNAETFEGNFAEVQKLSVGVALLPLLSKEIQVKTATLSGVSLNLARNKQGISNWDDLTQAQSGDAETPPEADTTPADSSPPPSFSLDGLTLENVNVLYDDRQAQQKVAVKNLGANIGAVNFGQPFELSLSFDVENANPQVNANIALSGTITADPNSKQYKIDGFNLQVNASGAAVGKTLVTSLNSNISADMDKQTIHLAQTKLTVDSTGLVGDKLLSSTLASDIAVNLAEQSADLTQLKLGVGPLTLAGNVSVKQFSDPVIKATLKTNTFDLKKTLAALGQAPIKTQLDSALTQIAAELDLTASTNSASLNQLNITLDDTQITGKASLKNFASPAITFTIDVTDINVDHYLPPASTEAAPATTAETTQPKGAPADLPLAALKALNINGKLAISKVIVSKLTLSGVALSVNAKHGLIKISQQIKSLYEGSQSSSATIDVRKKVATYKVKKNLVGVEIGPLLTDLGSPDIIEGTSNIKVDLTTRGNNPDSITKHLNGTVGFAFTDGALKWLDMIGSLGLNKQLSSLALKKAGFDPSSANGKTDFTEFKGNGQLKNGIMTLNDLQLVSPKLSAKGQGTIDLPQQTLDYKLALQQVKVRKDAQGKKTFLPKGRAINLTLTGPLSSPNKSVDVLAMLQDKEKDKVIKKLDKKLKEAGIPESISKDLKKFLPF